ncbi:hypothetical protein [Ruegeria sp. HKCCD7255]|nr:hypothetical protein [Ruegeria sp. HKCCD7255]
MPNSANSPLVARAMPVALDWSHPFGLNDRLTEKERMVRETTQTSH